ncbi:hypothetical protein [Marinicauda sp. Alg238-R41]|uniref:hypothetical protein n=1 Tax=Marinicauda sp. Alg238-R41 TaxID=2993447 RepID=UPI0022E312D5|nr:hypothetical protein [Marinicauda sp. Alg238-R41]
MSAPTPTPTALQQIAAILDRIDRDTPDARASVLALGRCGDEDRREHLESIRDIARAQQVRWQKIEREVSQALEADKVIAVTREGKPISCAHEPDPPPARS